VNNNEEIILPRRVVPQPVPFISPAGDCSGCALSGLLGLTGPAEVYARWPEEASIRKPEDKPRSLSWYNVRQVIRTASGEGLIQDYLDDMPIWIPNHGEGYYGAPGFLVALQWYRYLRMALQAGYYALANVVHGKTAPKTQPDHVVMLVGARCRWEEGPIPGSRSGSFEILVSCSSTSTPAEEWVEASEFLRDRGGFNLYLAKPSETPVETPVETP